MLRARIIPCLLLSGGRLIKTVQFGSPKYVGDPLNTVRLFNEKLVDELMVVDINATSSRRSPDYHLIRALASVCRMPLCYGGGVRECHEVEELVALGIEKVSLSDTAVRRPSVIEKAVKRVGSQSIVATLDVRWNDRNRRYDVFTHNGREATGMDLIECVRRCQGAGVGELVCNSIDRDGTMKGYDVRLVGLLCGVVKVPLTVLGGAGGVSECAELAQRFPVSGLAAGSIFVFKGKYKAVLVSYVSEDERSAFERAERVGPIRRD